MDSPKRFAFADPPYPGLARKFYSHDPLCAEVDHQALLHRLEQEYPDGWALSTNSVSLQYILSLCPSDVRIAAWVKPFCSFKPGVGVAYAWEPVIWKGGRPRTREQETVRDWTSANITLKRGLAGAKPEAFCYWLFELLNLQPGDTLDDLFPGTGAVSRAYAQWISAQRVWTSLEHPEAVMLWSQEEEEETQ